MQYVLPEIRNLCNFVKHLRQTHAQVEDDLQFLKKHGCSPAATLHERERVGAIEARCDVMCALRNESRFK